MCLYGTVYRYGVLVPRIILPATGALALLALAGCAAIERSELTYSDTESVAITQISVEPGSGDVVVRTGDISSVQIGRVVRYRGAEPRQRTFRIEGTRLFIDTDCGRQCGVSYDIVAPRGVSLDGENGSGDVRLTELAGVDINVGSGDIEVSDTSGTVRARTGSGTIRLDGAKGAVTARTGSGDITARRLSGGDVNTETGSGDISMLLDRASSVWARTASGSIDLAVPSGSYQVRAGTDSGDRKVDVTDQPGAPSVLDVHTGSGDVTVHPA